ncbi:hypothetical protein FACS189431_0420 [Alphaproteobacteria bacterium]|nr:hypothetical protein FACS189431_0420 [Alphaproteobacteria bacterium]
MGSMKKDGNKNLSDGQKLDLLISQFSGLSDQVGGIDSRVAGLSDQVGGIDSRVAGLSDQVGGIDSRVAGLSDQVGGIDSRVAGLSDQVGGIDSRVAGLSDQVSNLDSRVTGLENKLEETENNMLVETGKLISGLDQKVDVLVEHYDEQFKMLAESIDASRSRLGKIEKKNEDNDESLNYVPTIRRALGESNQKILNLDLRLKTVEKRLA